MTTTIDRERMLAARYGTDRNPWPHRVLVGAVVAAYLGAAAFAALSLVRGAEVEGRVLSWRAADRTVAVDLDVRGSAEGPVTCVVKAQDARSTDLGYREFTIAVVPSTTTVQLPTVFRASSVAVLGCGPVGEPLRVPPPDFPPGVAIP